MVICGAPSYSPFLRKDLVNVLRILSCSFKYYMYVHARSSVMVRSRAQLILFVHSWTGKNFVYVTENTRITRRCIFKSKIAAHCWAILVLFGSPFYGDLPGRYTCFSRLLPPKSLSRAEKTMFLYVFIYFTQRVSRFLFEVRNSFKIKLFLFKRCFDRKKGAHGRKFWACSTFLILDECRF